MAKKKSKKNKNDILVYSNGKDIKITKASLVKENGCDYIADYIWDDAGYLKECTLYRI